MSAFETGIVSSLNVLRNGGLILYPADTQWAIGCDATDPLSVARILRLTGGASSTSFVVLVTNEQDILKYVAAPDLALFDYLNTCQKITTVLYEGAIGLAENLISEDGSIRMRICEDLFCRHLIKRLGRPIVLASPNFWGADRPVCFDSIDPLVKKGVDHVVAYRQEEKYLSVPTVCIRWQPDGPVSIPC